MRQLMILLLAMLIANTAMATLADTATAKLPSRLFYKEPPSNIRDSVAEETRALRTKLDVTDAKLSDMAGIIKTASTKNPDATQDLMSKVVDNGPVAIFAIADLLVAEDEETRSNALTALAAMNKPLAGANKDYVPLEKLVVQLYNRSLFDCSRDIRSKALTLLTGLGWGYVFISSHHKAPPAIKLALEQVVINDPVPEIAQQADYSLQDLGFKPRDPERHDYVN